jgi:hypothetical protein
MRLECAASTFQKIDVSALCVLSKSTKADNARKKGEKKPWELEIEKLRQEQEQDRKGKALRKSRVPSCIFPVFIKWYPPRK